MSGVLFGHCKPDSDLADQIFPMAVQELQAQSLDGKGRTELYGLSVNVKAVPLITAIFWHKPDILFQFLGNAFSNLLELRQQLGLSHAPSLQGKLDAFGNF
jgi:hypothetical protein